MGMGNKEETEDDKASKLESERKEKMTNIVHNHFMNLLFEVLTEFTAYLKESVLDPCILEITKDLTLKSKFSSHEF